MCRALLDRIARSTESSRGLKITDNLEVKVPSGTVGARGTEFAVVIENDGKSTVVLLGPGKDNTLGLIPGNLQVSDGITSVDIVRPGFQSVVFK